jgi:hypothetical protein
LILLVSPAVGLAVVTILRPALEESERLPVLVVLPISLVWYFAYFVVFLIGLIVGAPMGVVLILCGVLQHRRGERATLGVIPERRLLLWRGLAVACGIFYSAGAVKVLTFRPDHLQYTKVFVGQPKSEVEKLFGAPGAIKWGPCEDAPDSSCEERVYHGSSSVWGNDSGWRMALQFRNDRVESGRVVGPNGHRFAITERPAGSANRQP